MVLACIIAVTGLAALIVLLLRRLISPTRFVQAAAGLTLGASIAALLAHEVGHG